MFSILLQTHSSEQLSSLTSRPSLLYCSGLVWVWLLLFSMFLYAWCVHPSQRCTLSSSSLQGVLRSALVLVLECGGPASISIGGRGSCPACCLPDHQLGEGVLRFRNLPSWLWLLACDTAFVAVACWRLRPTRRRRALEPAFWRQCRLDTRLLLGVMGLLLAPCSVSQPPTHHLSLQDWKGFRSNY